MNGSVFLFAQWRTQGSFYNRVLAIVIEIRFHQSQHQINNILDLKIIPQIHIHILAYTIRNISSLQYYNLNF